jgi:hypothetical protein
VLAIASWPLAIGTTAAAADPPILGRMTSVALSEAREFTVRLPASYAREPRRHYPVIYVLDGPPLDAHTADAAAANAGRGVSPELIVVGIPNLRPGGRARDFLPPFLTFARRDGSPFTGGADRFLRFLRDELIPRIERDYRTAAPRMLVGHSLGAIFVCYSLTQAPRLFDARFAHSPAIWRDEARIAGALSAFLAGSRNLGGFFFVSVGDGEGPSMSSGYHAVTTVLQTHAAAAGLRWAGRITPGAVHETNVALAGRDALAAYFAR